MISLDSILKSRDITLPTKVWIVKALVFPVVMYGCELDPEERWAPKNWCFWTVVLKTLESPLDCEEIQPVNPKGSQSWIFTGMTDAEAEAPILWPPDAKSQLIRKDPDAGKDWRQEEKGMTGWDGWMASLTPWTWVWASSGIWEGQGSLVCCSPWGCTESDTTEQLNKNNKNVRIRISRRSNIITFLTCVDLSHWAEDLLLHCFELGPQSFPAFGFKLKTETWALLGSQLAKYRSRDFSASVITWASFLQWISLCVCVCVCIYIQVYFRDIAGSVTDYHNKANIAIEWVTWNFWFPNAYKSYIYTIL